MNIPVVVELNPVIRELITGARENLLREELAVGLRELIRQLGLPGTPVLDIHPGNSSRAISVRVHQEFLFPSVELMQRLWLASTPPLLHEWIDNQSSTLAMGMDAWLVHYMTGLQKSQEDSAWNLVLKFLARLLLDLIKQHPACLLGMDQAAEYFHLGKEHTLELHWIEPETDETVATLKTYLQGLLSLGVSLANQEMVLLVFIGGQQLGRSIEDSIESAFLRLRTNRIDIRANPHSLGNLVEWTPGSDFIPVTDTRVNVNLQEGFHSLQVDMFDALGLSLPDLTLTLLPEQEPGTVVIVINGLPGAPIRMLGQGEALVNERLSNFSQLGITGRTARIPATGAIAAIISEENRERLQSEGYFIWNMPSYLILSLANEVRQMADRLLSLEDVEYQMALLEASFPELVHTVMSCYSLEDITRVLRELLSENIPIRDLRAVLEHLLQFDTIPVDSNTNVVLDERLPVHEADSTESRNYWSNYLEFVRTGLSDVISSLASHETNRLRVWLLGQELVGRVQELMERSQANEDPRVLDEAQVNPILEIIRDKVASLADTADWPVILTIPEIRLFLSHLLRTEFPRLQVLSFQELSPRLYIEPAETLELNA